MREHDREHDTVFVRAHDRAHDIVFAGHMMQNIFVRRIYREKS